MAFMLSNMAMIACYGEALVDLIVSPYSQAGLRTSAQACLGGSVFNFCIAAQRQGMQAIYLNALSRDSFGQQFRTVLCQEGVLVDAQEPCAEPTAMAVVQLDALGKASYSFYRQGVADTARSAEDIVANWNPAIGQLHTGCLMLVPEHWPKTRLLLEHALAQGCLVSVDANMRLAACSQLHAYRDAVLQACTMAHWVKVSDDDLVALGVLPEAHRVEQSIEAANNLLRRCQSHTRGIALTLGAIGACLVTPGATVKQAAPDRIEVKDTVGAGDAFMAALLAYFARQPDAGSHLQAALSHAVAAASLSVQRVGSNPPSWDETQEFLNAINSIAIHAQSLPGIG